jgi:hypothetical protein
MLDAAPAMLASGGVTRHVVNDEPLIARLDHVLIATGLSSQAA